MKETLVKRSTLEQSNGKFVFVEVKECFTDHFILEDIVKEVSNVNGIMHIQKGLITVSPKLNFHIERSTA